MKIFISLALKSLWHRRTTVGLTLISLSLSVFLILSVEGLRTAAEKSFTQTISQTDLIVGARTGPTNLVLSTVFDQGTFANNIKEKTYEFWKSHPSVEWTIPLVLGDGHRGFRVLATDINYFKHYRYQSDLSLSLEKGQWMNQEMDAVIGADVAQSLNYSLGSSIIIDHGVTHQVGLLHHDEAPFKVVGIMEKTGTIIDQTLFVSIESLEHLHGQHGELTGFFLKLKNRIDILSLQREINNYEIEPLSAVIPSAVINDLWHLLSRVEQSLRALGACVLGVSLLSLLSILLSTLNERKREMAILRSLGARPLTLSSLLILESGLVTIGSLFFGTFLYGFILWILKEWLKNNYGLFIDWNSLQNTNMTYLLMMALAGVTVGFIPAIKVYQTTLKEGLLVQN